MKKFINTITVCLISCLLLSITAQAWEVPGFALKKGCSNKNHAVQELQDKLNQCGYNLSIDGDFGAKTEEAVKDFQKKKHLAIDGSVGPATKKAIDDDILSRPSTKGFIQLPSKGTGYKTYKTTYNNNRFGKPETIAAIQKACKAFSKIEGASLIYIGELSSKNGGWLAPHTSHQKGVDVDINPMKTTDLNRKLINAIRSNGDVRLIYYNDSTLIEEGLCTKLSGHDNHLHVSYNY